MGGSDYDDNYDTDHDDNANDNDNDSASDDDNDDEQWNNGDKGSAARPNGFGQ